MYFNLKNGISNHLVFYKDFNETLEDIKKKIDNLVHYKVDFAHLSAHSTNSANVNFGKFHSAYTYI